MKKVVSLFVILLSFVMIGVTTSVFATDSVLETNTGNNVQGATELTAADLNTATTIPTDNNSVISSDDNNLTSGVENQLTTSNGTDTNSAYKTVDEDDTDKDKMPQTGIEDHYVGLLLIVCVAAAIFTYRKMKDYKNV